METTENVRVVIRIRPFLQTETRDTPLQVRQQGIQITTPNQQPRQFQFDSVLPPQTSQAEVYDAAARDVVQNNARTKVTHTSTRPAPSSFSRTVEKSNISAC